MHSQSFAWCKPWYQDWPAESQSHERVMLQICSMYVESFSNVVLQVNYFFCLQMRASFEQVPACLPTLKLKMPHQMDITLHWSCLSHESSLLYNHWNFLSSKQAFLWSCFPQILDLYGYTFMPVLFLWTSKLGKMTTFSRWAALRTQGLALWC